MDASDDNTGIFNDVTKESENSFETSNIETEGTINREGSHQKLLEVSEKANVDEAASDRKLENLDTNAGLDDETTNKGIAIQEVESLQRDQTSSRRLEPEADKNIIESSQQNMLLESKLAGSAIENRPEHNNDALKDSLARTYPSTEPGALKHNAKPEGGVEPLKHDHNSPPVSDQVEALEPALDAPAVGRPNVVSSSLGSSPKQQVDSGEATPRFTAKQLKVVSENIETENSPPAKTINVLAPPSQTQQPNHFSQQHLREPVYVDSEYDSLARAAVDASSTAQLLVEFRRGADNSHVNRMVEGSYSRLLLSANYLSEPALYNTFYGEAPAFGLIPRGSLYSRSEGTHAPGRYMPSEYGMSQDRSRTRNGSSLRDKYTYPGSARGTNNSPLSHKSKMRETSRATSGGSEHISQTHRKSATPHMGREEALLDSEVYQLLNKTKTNQLRDPRHARVEGDTDHIYYNHKSKGFFVPHRPPGDALLLQYNHLYDFGDGTRMMPLQRRGDKSYVRYRLNPHAKPPRTYAESKGSSWRYYNNPNPNSTDFDSQKSPCIEQRTSSRVYSKPSPRGESTASSLRTARALDVQRLHISQFRNAPSIEEVMGQHPDTMGRLGTESNAAISRGRLHPEELPAGVQDQIQAAASVGHEGGMAASKPSSAASVGPQHVGDAVGRRNSLPSKGGSGQRYAFTDRPADGLFRFAVGQGPTRFPALQQPPTLAPPPTRQGATWRNDSKGNPVAVLNNTELPRVGATKGRAHTNGGEKAYFVSRLRTRPTTRQ
ncbi:unnamed protein product [Phytomonas sp. EM1]|nr:unnamed protein product [Phytomonas sp. EM1]|eukprot:CCW61864.1 unnamed protein product [Phytomonas sp. isolate EM1]